MANKRQARSRRVKSTTTASLHSSTPSTTGAHTRSQIQAAFDAAQSGRSAYLQSQLAVTRAAASALIQETGAPPDEGLPTIPDGEDDPLSGWQDVREDDDEDEEMEISHEGGERRDRMCATFEYMNRARYVGPFFAPLQ